MFNEYFNFALSVSQSIASPLIEHGDAVVMLGFWLASVVLAVALIAPIGIPLLIGAAIAQRLIKD